MGTGEVSGSNLLDRKKDGQGDVCVQAARGRAGRGRIMQRQGDGGDAQAAPTDQSQAAVEWQLHQPFSWKHLPGQTIYERMQMKSMTRPVITKVMTLILIFDARFPVGKESG